MPDAKLTNAEHERERRAFWDACCAAAYSNTEHSDERGASYAAQLATAKLAERDKTFPAPVEEESRDTGEYDPPARRCATCADHLIPWNTNPCASCGGDRCGYKNWRPK